MQRIKYFFPSKVINQMNIPFTIKLATNDLDDIISKKLEFVTENINERLHQIDLIFSPFRYDSLVSRFQRGDKQVILESEDFQTIYGQATLAEQMTDGIFTSHFAGRYDPTRLVKGWAIEQVFDEYLKPLLKDPKIDGVYLSGDGNIKFATRQESDFSWGINIEDADDSHSIIATYHLNNGAIATSEKGGHAANIIRMKQSQVQQVTVISDNLVDADVWATVGVLAGSEKFAEMINEYNLSGILINKNEEPLSFSEGTMINSKEATV